MKIVILGAGETGMYAASALSQEEHDVTLIDEEPLCLDQANREIDVATILASMPNISVLSTLANTKPDLFFAATGNDETNLISCSLAKNLGIAKTVAKIKSRPLLQPGLLDISRLFCVDHFIGSELLSAQELYKLLIHSGDLAFQHFVHDAVLMRTIVIPEEWKQGNVPIRDLRLPPGLIAGFIRRENQFLFPHGDDHILPGDEATLIGETSIMNRLHELFHIPEKKIKTVVIVGGSEIAVHLGSMLLHERVSVRIIEKNALRCKELADLLPQARIIHRDALHPSLLREENIREADAVLCCTENEGTNFLVSSMAAHLGCPQSIALVHDPSYIPLFEKANVIPALSSRIHVANRLLSILHEKTVLSVGSISKDAAKIVELKISPSSSLVGIPLSELKLPKDFLIAIVENQGKVKVGNGKSILCPEDTAVAICSTHCLEQNHHIFR